MKKNNIGRPAFENASTRTFKLNDGEYFVVKALVDCLRNLYSYNELNDGDFPIMWLVMLFVLLVTLKKI